jgi:WD40-like Beta Propeller Repeat
MTASTNCDLSFGKRVFWPLVFIATVIISPTGSRGADLAQAPEPPIPERIAVTELPLPPTVPSRNPGACTPVINPNRTGCIDSAQSGSFLPDGHHVLAVVRFAGAPAAPDPASVYEDLKIILVKTDGAKFPNGDSWKCVTCGVPAQNAVGTNGAWDYPQSFHDGKRILAGTNIIDCSPFRLADKQCTAERVHIFPIRWEVRADGSGKGGSIRELRLHPDDIHLGFNSISISRGKFDQFGYLGRLEFNLKPKSGEPLAPRYELVHVNRLFQEGLDKRVLTVDSQHPDVLRVNLNAIEVGEFRGFSKNGREVFYVGYPFESSNIDLFAADLLTGRVRRLTSNPEYADPIDASPDDKWIVVEDTRGSDRQMFVAGMRGIPPLTDLITSGAVSSIRNNGERRFFQPFLIDRYGDRGAYQGQQLNAGDGKPGSTSDPNWNAMADPRWSPDGTSVVYWQTLVTSPACGGSNPLPCPLSTEPGGRRFRMMIARLTSRKPLSIKEPSPISDSVPWGTPYTPGSPIPTRALVPEGTYTLKGLVSGFTKVTITDTVDHSAIATVTISYNNYSDNRNNIINGTESVSQTRPTPTKTSLDWHSNLVETGATQGSKVTSLDGFKLTIDIMLNNFFATGTMTTTINGHTYQQPANGD